MFVNAANAHGGINGRKIHAIITTFDPTNEAEMRADCLQWTKGNPAVFAVVDGLGSWTGDNELCITQEGHTAASSGSGRPPPTGPSSARPLACGGPVPTSPRS